MCRRSVSRGEGYESERRGRLFMAGKYCDVRRSDIDGCKFLCAKIVACWEMDAFAGTSRFDGFFFIFAVKFARC